MCNDDLCILQEELELAMKQLAQARSSGNDALAAHWQGQCDGLVQAMADNPSPLLN